MRRRSPSGAAIAISTGQWTSLWLGSYPEISLERAKLRHQYARKLLAHGIDPCAIRSTLGRNVFRLHMREWENMETVTDPTARRPDLGAPFTVATPWLNAKTSVV